MTYVKARDKGEGLNHEECSSKTNIQKSNLWKDSNLSGYFNKMDIISPGVAFFYFY